MYRPKDWHNPNESYKKYFGDIEPSCVQEHEYYAYEAGADALEVSLLSKGIHAEKGEWITVRGGILEDDDSVPVAGTWCFIPDKEK
jgi:hypothetical protein